MSRWKRLRKQTYSEANHAMTGQRAREGKHGVQIGLTAICVALMLLVCSTFTSAYLFDTKALSSPFTMHIEDPAFAVYSADDQSLNFYKRTEIPFPGDAFEGKEATAVYVGIESMTARPWSSQISDVQTVSVIDEGISPISCKNWFFKFANCKTMDLARLDTTAITNTSGMFQSCTSLTTIYASDKWNISNDTASQNMFLGCKKLVGGNGTAYNASYVGKEYARIDRATTPGYLTYVSPKQAFAIYSADDQSLSFYNRYGMPSAGSLFENKTATTIYTGFESSSSCPWGENREKVKSVKVIDEGIAPVSCTNWFAQFTVCETMDLSKLDTYNTTDMGNMFFYARRLGHLDLSGWNTSNVKNMSAMFDRSTVPSNGMIGLSDLDTSNVVNMAYMFRENPSLAALDLSSRDTSSVTNMYCMFSNCTSLASLKLSNWNTSNVADMSRMFYNCRSLKALDLSSFNTSKVTNLTYTFYLCSGLTSLDVSNFDTSSVKYMTGTFYGCWSLVFLDVSTWNTSETVKMDQMFFQCNALPSIDLSSFDTSNVETVLDMFYNCRMMVALDLSNWDTSNIATFDGMFDNCMDLESIYVSQKWSTSSIVSGFDMFKDCISLVGGNGTTYDASHLDESYARIDTMEAPGYLTNVLQKGHVDVENEESQDVDQIVDAENYTDVDQAAENAPTNEDPEIIDNEEANTEVPDVDVADAEANAANIPNEASGQDLDEDIGDALSLFGFQGTN